MQKSRRGRGEEGKEGSKSSTGTGLGLYLGLCWGRGIVGKRGSMN